MRIWRRLRRRRGGKEWLGGVEQGGDRGGRGRRGGLRGWVGK